MAKLEYEQIKEYIEQSLKHEWGNRRMGLQNEQQVLSNMILAYDKEEEGREALKPAQENIHQRGRELNNLYNLARQHVDGFAYKKDQVPNLRIYWWQYTHHSGPNKGEKITVYAIAESSDDAREQALMQLSNEMSDKGSDLSFVWDFIEENSPGDFGSADRFTIVHYCPKPK